MRQAAFVGVSSNSNQPAQLESFVTAMKFSDIETRVIILFRQYRIKALVRPQGQPLFVRICMLSLDKVYMGLYPTKHSEAKMINSGKAGK